MINFQSTIFKKIKYINVAVQKQNAEVEEKNQKIKKTHLTNTRNILSYMSSISSIYFLFSKNQYQIKIREHVKIYRSR